MTIAPKLICLALASLPATAIADSNGNRLHDLEHFFEAADVRSGPELVDCTLSEGAVTTCFKITVATNPLTYTPGPWCPNFTIPIQATSVTPEHWKNVRRQPAPMWTPHIRTIVCNACQKRCQKRPLLHMSSRLNPWKPTARHPRT